MKMYSSNVNYKLGNILRKLREQNGWSQEEFADKCGIHRTYVSQLERGLKSPTIQLFWILCDCLKINPSDYLKELEKALENTLYE